MTRVMIVPRAAWGADESLRFDCHGNECWTEEREPVRGIVLHPTAPPTARAMCPAAPPICAHRDLAEVACPGDAFYPTLPELRAAVTRRLARRPAQLATASAA
jgi:hypothetical protein